MTKRAIIATTTGHDYSFLSVIAALCWRDRIGFEPSLFLVGTEGEWHRDARTQVVMGAISTHALHHVFVDHIPGVEDSTIAQCCRQYAACHPFSDDDYLICSDADLLPIRKEFYHQHDLQKHAIALWYANAYLGEEFYHWPSCHYGMTVATWRDVMGLEIGKMPDCMIRNFKEYGLDEKMADWKADPKKFWPVWFTDELIASKKILSSSHYPTKVLKIDRMGHPPADRLDRSSWPFFADPDRYTDCHSLRPGWSDPNWPRLAPFLKKILPQHSRWLDTYRAGFREAMGVGA